MLTSHQLEAVEALFELDPLPTYSNRAADVVAQLSGASSHRIVTDDAMQGTPPSTPMALAVSLRHGRDTVGVLLLTPPAGGRFSDEQMRLARWAGRVMARGMAYARRLESAGGPRADLRTLLDHTPLTPRERDVVGRLVAGSSTRDIADSTGLTVATVNTYMKRIFAKLGVHSRIELLARVTGTHGVFPQPS